MKNSIRHAILKSDVAHLKMEEFGKIDTFMILVAYCLKRLTFTFQIIKCPHVWKNLRCQNLLWLHYKYLKYWIQKIHFELGHPVKTLLLSRNFRENDFRFIPFCWQHFKIDGFFVRLTRICNLTRFSAKLTKIC